MGFAGPNWITAEFHRVRPRALKLTRLPTNWKHKVLKQKTGTFKVKKNCVLGRKTSKKEGFFGLCRSTLEHFGISLCHTKDAEDHEFTSQLDAQGVPTNKKSRLGEKMPFVPKNIKKMGLSAVFKVCTKTFWKFTVRIR